NDPPVGLAALAAPGGWKRPPPKPVPAAELLRARSFQIWAYHISHARMVIRSSRGEGHPRNLDMVFLGVDYLSLPSRLEGLEIAEPTAADLDRVRAAYRTDVQPEFVHVLASKGRRNIVVAAGVKVEENDLESFDSGLDRYMYLHDLL